MGFLNDKVVSRILHIVVKMYKFAFFVSLSCGLFLRYPVLCYPALTLENSSFPEEKRKRGQSYLPCSPFNNWTTSRVLWLFQKGQLFQSFCHRPILEPTQYIFYIRITPEHIHNIKSTSYVNINQRALKTQHSIESN